MLHHPAVFQILPGVLTVSVGLLYLNTIMSMRRSFDALFVGLIFAGCSASAATNIVLLTDNLQEKIEAAAPGDTLVLESGAYPGALSIKKPLAFVRSGSTPVTLLADVTVQATGAVSFVQMNFSGGVGVSGETRLQLLDSQVGANLAVTNGSLMARRSKVDGRIDLSAAAVQGFRLTNSGGIFGNARAGAGTRSVFTQSDLSSLQMSQYEVWLGYSLCGPIVGIDCSSILVGNTVRSYYRGGRLIDLNRGTVKCYNNQVYALGRKWDASSGIILLVLDGTNGEIVNNSFWSYQHSDDWNACYARGIHVGGNAKVAIRNCAVEIGYTGNQVAIEGATPIAEVSYCCLVARSGAVLGANPYQCIFASPGYKSVSESALDFTLALSSPCLDAGAPQPFFQDRDGTRNDIGYTGGPLYQANGMTTDKPLLFWIMPEQRQIWKNSQPTLDIEAAATAGH